MDRNLTILVAEDNPNEAKLLELALLKANIKNPVQVVGTGSEVIGYLQGSGQFADRGKYPFPSVIFTDLKMPGMDGFDVLRWLQKHPICSITPVIVLTNSSADSDVKEAYQLGANAYLVKPAALDELTHMIGVACEFWSLCAKPSVPEN
jgi:CheY-like chemotaxis protein